MCFRCEISGSKYSWMRGKAAGKAFPYGVEGVVLNALWNSAGSLNSCSATIIPSWNYGATTCACFNDKMENMRTIKTESKAHWVKARFLSTSLAGWRLFKQRGCFCNMFVLKKWIIYVFLENHVHDSCNCHNQSQAGGLSTFHVASEVLEQWRGTFWPFFQNLATSPLKT